MEIVDRLINLYRTNPKEFWDSCSIIIPILPLVIVLIVMAFRTDWKTKTPKDERRKTIVKTKILDVFSEYTTHKEGVAGRALVGGIIAGPIGALAGASTAGSRTYEHRKTRFKIWYADGHTAVKVVRNDSSKYLELIKYVE